MTDGAGWHLAQVNVALPRASLDDPAMSGFVHAVDDVNWLADRSAGFVWRLSPRHGPVTLGPLAGHRVIVTLSVWKDVEALQRYVYRSGHALFMQRRARWFEPIGGFTTALWWVPAGELPGFDDALDRLEGLRACGPSPRAFSLGLQFDTDGLRAGRR